jgi:hypothetical protein
MSPSTVTREELRSSPRAVEEPPTTSRFARSELTAALAAMDLADSMEADESTRVVSAESNARLLAHALQHERDEEPTLDATAPAITRGMPCPIGHGALDALAGFEPGRIDTGSGPEHAVIPPKTTFASGALDDLDRPFFAPLSLPDARHTTIAGTTGASRASSPSHFDVHIPLVRSGVRERLTPEAADAIVQGNERQDHRVRTRWLVLGIWAAALSLAAVLGFIAATSPGARTTSVDIHAMKHAR